MQNPKGKKMIDEDILTAEVLTDLVDEENTTKEKMETKQIEEEIKRLEERIRKLEERHRKITTYDTLKLKKHN